VYQFSVVLLQQLPCGLASGVEANARHGAWLGCAGKSSVILQTERLYGSVF
jgi:hypothetical protein